MNEWKPYIWKTLTAVYKTTQMVTTGRATRITIVLLLSAIVNNQVLISNIW